MKVLDLFCGAGGVAMGLHRAWPHAQITGVDIRPQPRYPFNFVQADAMTFPLEGYDFIWASPPCQAFTAYRRTGNVGERPDLIAPTRERLIASGTPWAIENVVGAPLKLPTLLCGSMFGLDVRRHRYFETSRPILSPSCNHAKWEPNRFPGGRSKERTGSNRGLARGTVEVGSWDIDIDVQKRAMGIDWMELPELSQAIPPAYSEFIARQMFD